MASPHARHQTGGQAWFGLSIAIATFAASLFLWSDANAESLPESQALVVANTAHETDRPRISARPSIDNSIPSSLTSISAQDNVANSPARNSRSVSLISREKGIWIGLGFMLTALTWMVANRERRLW